MSKTVEINELTGREHKDFINSLVGGLKTRVDMFIKHGLQLLVFDARVNYHTNGNMETVTRGIAFGSFYFCKGLLTDNLVFRKLRFYERSLS